MKLSSLWDLAVLGSVSAQTLPVSAANLRLRTKLLLSFVLLSSGLTCATLLVVRRSAQVHMQHHVYQVVLQRFYDGPPVKSNRLGTVVVGRSMDVRAASDLGRISSSQIIFRYGKDVVVSTLSALQEQEVVRQIQDLPTQEQAYIGNERFLTSVVDLTPGSLPTANVIILKSYKEAAATLARLNHLLLGLGLLP